MLPDKGPYHHLVMGSSPTSFRNLFLTQWEVHIKTFPPRYQVGKQLLLGSRFRPLLVAWGYLLSGSAFDKTQRAELARAAVYIELLHKATILIDDLVDLDEFRNGEPSFHIQFSVNEAILFAVYLFGDCLERLSEANRAMKNESRSHPGLTELLSIAVKEMSLGALEEIISPAEQLTTIVKAKRIIELQTVAMLKNGLLTGYKYGCGSMEYLEIIDSIGYDCGYLFQLLNDLEPFLGAELNLLHKGGVNFDILHSRKNIVVAFVSESLSSSERETLHTLMRASDPSLPALLNAWFSKYNVFSTLLDNLGAVKGKIAENIKTLPLDQKRRNGFSTFADHVLSVALRRIEGPYGERLSEILIS
jgi:geranylgeranyl pyrophosphate synthase